MKTVLTIIRKKLSLIFSALIFFNSLAVAQNKMLMDESIYAIWNRISGAKISSDGEHLLYHLVPGYGDQVGKVYELDSKNTISIDRAENGVFAKSGRFALFTIKPSKELIKEMKRKKTKKDKMPKDSLAILNLVSGKLTIIPDIISFEVPEKWDGIITYVIDPEEEKGDSTSMESRRKKKLNTKSNQLIVRKLEEGKEDTIEFVDKYELSEKYPGILIHRQSNDDEIHSGIYMYDCNVGDLHLILHSDSSCDQLGVSHNGNKAAFIMRSDTNDTKEKKGELYFWGANQKLAHLIADRESVFLPEDWEISKYRRIQWTKDDSWFEFGISAPMIEPDTTLLDEEIVNVEIWNYQDGRLYTQQEIRGDEEKKRSYSVIYNPDEERFISVTGKDRSEVRFAPDLVGPYAAVYNELPYLKYISWLGYSYKDLYSVNLQNGESLLIAKKIQGNVSVSPGAIY